MSSPPYAVPSPTFRGRRGEDVAHITLPPPDWNTDLAHMGSLFQQDLRQSYRHLQPAQDPNNPHSAVPQYEQWDGNAGWEICVLSVQGANQLAGYARADPMSMKTVNEAFKCEPCNNKTFKNKDTLR